MKKTYISISFLFFVTLQTLFSQITIDTTNIRLSEVEVNAESRKIYSELGRILVSIDKKEIAKSAVTCLDQLLDFVAGIDIRQRGVNGVQADISVRGGSFDQVLVLINGVNITDPQTGHFNLDIPLNISDVSKVEILQGSSARILGPNAFSGAINIVTDNNSKKALSAEIVTGSYNYYAPSISGNFGNGNLKTFVSLAHKSSDGYMDFTDFNMNSAFIQSGLATKNAGKFDIQLATQLKAFGANSFYSLKYPNQYENTKTFLSSLNWSLNKGNFRFNAQALWRRHQDRYELYRDSITVKPPWYKGHNYHMTDIVNVKATAAYISILGKTTLGVDIRNEHVFSNALGEKMDSMAVPFEDNKFFTKSYNRLISTGLIDHSISSDKWNLSFGLASTYSDDFQFSTYGGIDLGYTLNEHVQFYVSANAATRLPTFTDLFLSTSVQQGNINLKPEQSKTLELGTKITKSQWRLTSAVFYRKGENVIDWIKQNSTSVKYEASNLAEVNALGGDFTFEYSFKASFVNKVGISYSYLQLDKTAEGFDSKYALDYLMHKLSFKLEHKVFNKLSASWNAGYFERAGNYDANTMAGKPADIANYNPYYLVDSRLLWTQKKYSIFFDVNNILDTKYSDYGGIPQPGINFTAGLRLKL